MKLSFICVGLAVMLLGCVNDSLPLDEDDETSVEDPTEEFYGSFEGDDAGGALCDLYQPIVMTVDGMDMVIEIPVMCDPRPMIDKGDPPPDRINPGEEVERHENPGDPMYPFTSDPQDTSNLI